MIFNPIQINRYNFNIPRWWFFALPLNGFPAEVYVPKQERIVTSQPPNLPRWWFRREWRVNLCSFRHLVSELGMAVDEVFQTESYQEEAIPKQKIGGNITFFVRGFVCVCVDLFEWWFGNSCFECFFLSFVPAMERIRFAKFLWIPTVLWLLLNWNFEPTSCVLPMAGNTSLGTKQEYHALIAFRILQWQGW